MNAAVKWGVILAVVIAALSVSIAVTGMHRSPIVGLVFVVVAIVINIAAVFMALRQTAGENSYIKQLLGGLLIGVVAGILIFLSSWLMLSVVFPNYLAESREGAIAFLESMNLPEDQLDVQIEKLDDATPLNQAVSGLIGTFFTSLFAGAIIGIFQRRK